MITKCIFGGAKFLKTMHQLGHKVHVLLYVYTAFCFCITRGHFCNRFKMLPKGYVVIPNNDIIGETEAGTVEKCAMACINTERCISCEFQPNSGIGKDCILRATFITNPEKIIPAPDRTAFY